MKSTEKQFLQLNKMSPKKANKVSLLVKLHMDIQENLPSLVVNTASCIKDNMDLKPLVMLYNQWRSMEWITEYGSH